MRARGARKPLLQPKRQKARRCFLKATLAAVGLIFIFPQTTSSWGRVLAAVEASVARGHLVFVPGAPLPQQTAAVVEAVAHLESVPASQATSVSTDILDASSPVLAAVTARATEPELLFAGFAPAVFGCFALLMSVVQLLNTSSEEGSSSQGSRWNLRTAAIFLVWACLIFYSFTCAPGMNDEGKLMDKTLIEHILTTPFDGEVSPFFVAVFNSLGIWPAVYAATLLPGSRNQSPVPAWPFLGGSFFLGAFALSPYLALREYRGAGRADQRSNFDFITKNILESPLNGLLLLAGGIYLALYAFGNGNINGASLVAGSTAW
eukprot:CAMPEP_0172666402 /NCGR_PEP_ID=MMETSP1074-20121228/7777_1 /TAXON_ID=2916 /ORGANISM="Ceratium fusus, Strain PA161109" /LENGTH=319 /DNA_ID=CAMNT_0013482777 /DNA_START=38 /DNA_END=994 /DNA_ORIENTATION=+